MDRTARIAEAARSHSGCSSVIESALYTEIVVREADRTAEALPYYLKNPQMSSCALTVLGALRLAGCTEPECVASYYPSRVGRAFADLESLARRYNAFFQTGHPASLQMGDIWIITKPDGSDAHTGLCVENATEQADGSVTVVTVEGGQWNGVPPPRSDSSAIGTFTRRFVKSGSSWMMGERCLWATIDAASLPVPDSNE